MWDLQLPRFISKQIITKKSSHISSLHHRNRHRKKMGCTDEIIQKPKST